MIQLHPEYLIFQTSQGELIPCSAESVTIELIGDASSLLDPEVVREAASAVVHYFKNELGRETVSVTEFSKALERVLNCFGFNVVTSTGEKETPANIRTTEMDLSNLVGDSVAQFELAFFNNLRSEFRKQVQSSPDILQFVGLRPTVKQMVGAKRWCHRCEAMSDQIVAFLRECLIMESGPLVPALVVR